MPRSAVEALLPLVRARWCGCRGCGAPAQDAPIRAFVTVWWQTKLSSVRSCFENRAANQKMLQKNTFTGEKR